MLDINDMLIFEKVAETKGISAAARVLNIPKSRVSRRVAALEKSIGARLLERSTRSLRLTEAGAIYWQHCRRVAEEVASAWESVNSLQKQPRGHLRISASVTMGQYILAPHLAQFSKMYPEISLEIKLDNRRVQMIAEGFDLVIRVGTLDDSMLISRRMGGGIAQLYAAPGYLKQMPLLREPADLAKHKTLSMSDSGRENQWLLQNSSGEQHNILVQSHINTNDFFMLREIASGGAGVVMAPSYLMEEQLKSKALVNVLPQWRSPSFSFYALYPSRHGLTQKTRAFLDFFTHKMDFD